jgi:capsular exopolysaccharide synthesis family protein
VFLRRLGRSKRYTPPQWAGDNDPSESLVTLVNPASRFSEAYRNLRTNLLYGFIDSPPKVVVTTSPGRHEGKTTTCANLGIVFAQINNNTLIVDCDLREPVMHKMFGVPNLLGIANVLVGERSLQEVYHEPVPGLKVLSAGPVPPDPAELLSSRQFGELMGEVRGQFDQVLVDSPPINLVSDAAIIAGHCDGVLLVLDAQNTRKGSVRQGVRKVETIGARLLGTVMNNTGVPEDKASSLGGYYGGYYTN